MSDKIEVRVQLSIETDDTVPFPLVQLAVPEITEGSEFINIVGTNFTESNDGAKAIAVLLQHAAMAILEELDETGEERAPVRPRFNPKPVGSR